MEKRAPKSSNTERHNGISIAQGRVRHEGVFVSTPVGNDPIQASRSHMDSIIEIALLGDPLITLATYDLGHVMATDCNAAYARTRMRVPIMKPIYG
jgi:hypothetical protein